MALRRTRWLGRLALAGALAACGPRGRSGGDVDGGIAPAPDLTAPGPPGPRVRVVVDPSLPAGIADQFDAATPAAGGVTVVYPNPGAVIPHDLAPLDAQWITTHGADVYRVSFIVDDGDRLDGFVTALSWTPATADWQWLLDRAAGHTVTLTVAAAHLDGNRMLQADVRTSAGQPLRVSRDDATGALFYFATVGDQLTGEGTLERLEVGAQKADKYLNKTNDGGRCVGCHALSRDGARLAFTFLDIAFPVTLTLGAVDAARPTMQQAPAGIAAAQSVFSPDGTKVLTSFQGRLELRDGQDGHKLGDVPTTGPALYPDWSPDGSAIVFVRPRSLCRPNVLDFGQQSIFVYGGSLVTMKVQNGVFSAEQVVLAAAGADNNYYPAYAPDGSAIAFSRSDGVSGSSWSVANSACAGESGAGLSYDNPSSTVWMISAQGGAPIALAAANGSGRLTNSWPKWGPKGDGEYLWLSFSSTRAYGHVLPVAQAHHQLWFTAVARGEPAGDPSAPAVWFPFQDTATKNHIGTWSIKVGDYRIQ